MVSSRKDLLKKIELFADCNEKDLKLLSKLSSIQKIADKEFFVKEGDTDKRLFIIESGAVEVSKEWGDKDRPDIINRTLLTTINAGKVVGEMALFEDKPRSASLRAKSDTQLIVINIDQLKSHPQLYAKIAVRLSQILSERLRQVNETTVKPTQTKDVLKTINLFADCDDREFKTLEKLASHATILKGNFFVNEGETDKRLFVIVSGKIDVLKRGTDKANIDHIQYHRLTTLNAGHVVGEMALLEDKPRSASLRARTDTHAIILYINQLKNHPKLYAKLAVNLSKLLSDRLRHTNEVTVKSMQKELRASNDKVRIAVFLIYMLTITALYTISLNFIQFLIRKGVIKDVTLTSFFIIIGFALALTAFVIHSKYPLRTFGITLKNWRPALKDSMIVSGIIIVIATIAKFLFIHLVPGYEHVKLFDFGLEYWSRCCFFFTQFKLSNYIFPLVVYTLGCPLQEFIARGAMQGSIEKFLGSGLLSTWITIIVSNLIFAAAHTHLNYVLSIVSFVSGLMWGWMYHKQKTLLGVTASHIVLGFWAIFILGVSL